MDTELNRKKLIGVEVTNSGRNAVCLNEEGVILDSYKVSVKESEESILHLGNLIGELKKKFGDFEKVGIAIPGLLDRKTKRVAYSTHIPEHTGIDFLSELEKIAGVKIHIENDANAAAFGEYELGAGRNSDSMFYITLGSGVGGALIFDNKLWHGASGFAGEFGYLSINSEGVRLEDVASSKGIISRTKGRFHQDQTSSLIEIDEENIAIEDIVSHAEKGDFLARFMLERTGFYVGTAVADVINLLNIEKIVINGIIMQAGDLVLNVIKDRARELSFKPNFEAVEIVKGDFGETASAMGAALLSQKTDS